MALGTTLPAWPAVVFAYLEPISLLLGYHSAVFKPAEFVTTQLPPSALNQPTPAALLISYTLGNTFLILCGFGLLCTFITREARVTKWYLAILAVGDIGHVWGYYQAMGSDVFWNFGEYNEMMWGNIGFTVFLHVHRLLTLAGAFGRLGGRAGSR